MTPPLRAVLLAGTRARRCRARPAARFHQRGLPRLVPILGLVDPRHALHRVGQITTDLLDSVSALRGYVLRSRRHGLSRDVLRDRCGLWRAPGRGVRRAALADALADRASFTHRRRRSRASLAVFG